MDMHRVRRIADAVLYEGYALYPYRRSALKNRQRWSFGVLYPDPWPRAPGSDDRATMQTQCLAVGGPEMSLEVSVRFLHLVQRGIRSSEESPGEPNAAWHSGWQEGIEREVTLPARRINELDGAPHRIPFSFPSSSAADAATDCRLPIAVCRLERSPARERGDPESEISNQQSEISDRQSAISNPQSAIAAFQQRVDGFVELWAERVGDNLFRLSATVGNVTPLADPAITRDQALVRSFVSTHAVLGLRGGAFISLLDPGRHAAEAAACRNIGCWPVLVGDEGQTDLMLAAPIILYDYPQIAAESPGDFFDGTEIDEMLALRVLTLADSEKEELRAAEPRVRSLLERTEALPRDQLLGLHGTMRSSAACSAGPIEGFHPGDRVRLRPRGRADAFDLLLTGKTATIASVEQDLEDRIYLSVVVDDDPGRDFGERGQPGHRFFFSPEEVEPC